MTSFGSSDLSTYKYYEPNLSAKENYDRFEILFRSKFTHPMTCLQSAMTQYMILLKKLDRVENHIKILKEFGVEAKDEIEKACDIINDLSDIQYVMTDLCTKAIDERVAFNKRVNNCL